MSMTIQERMAMQARMAKASSKPAPQAAPSPAPAGISVAERIARQNAAAAAEAARRPKIAPPPDERREGGVSVAERIAMQSMAAAQQQKSREANMSSDEVISAIRSRYQDFLKNLESLDMGDLFFGAKPSEPSDASEAAPNGISTAEGEAVLPAAEQVQVNTYQATPVIAPARARRKRKAEAVKAEEKPAEEPAAEVVESAETEG